MKTIKIISWNVNGIRAAVKKDVLAWVQKNSPDIMCFQEIKAQESQLPSELQNSPLGYEAIWNPAERAGYSGVSTWTRQKPLFVKKGFGLERFDREGRVIQIETPEFVHYNIYFPNGGMNEDRLRFKLDFYNELLKHILFVKKKGKRIIISGDVNTAHHPIDLARPEENEDTSGFMPIERAWVDKLLASGFVDTFRALNKDLVRYSWWDMRTGARQRNLGWRIDYHFVSEDLRPYIKDAAVHHDITGSDHCPVSLRLQF